MPVRSEFLSPGYVRPPLAAAVPFDYPSTEVGSVGRVTVYYATSLGNRGETLAIAMLDVVLDPYNDMEKFFGVAGGPVSVVVAPLSANNDGTKGAYHYGCNFASGGTLYLDATFNLPNQTDGELALYVAELSECFMGAQALGWSCLSSNGEGLSRYFAAVDTPAGAFPSWAITGPTWVSAGYPDWVTVTEPTDRNHISTGCAVLYLYYVRSLGFTSTAITRAGGATLADNYKTLTGLDSAYADLKAAVQAFTVTGDNPFPPPTYAGELLSYGDAGTPGNVSEPEVVGFQGWQDFKRLFAGANVNGENRIYAVDANGELFSYGDAGTPSNVSDPVVVGFGGWLNFKYMFGGRNAVGQDRIYAVNTDGELLSYGDAGTPGNVSDPVVVGFGGWQQFDLLFCGRNAVGQDRIYAVNTDGELLSYGDAGTPGNVSDPVVVGFGGWQQFDLLFCGRNAVGEDRIYAVNTDGELLSYGDAGTPGNVSDPVVVGFGGWLNFKWLFGGRNAVGQNRSMRGGTKGACGARRPG